MPAPTNEFKRRLLARQRQIGLWLALANAYTAEIASLAGFDWLLIDGEHAPNDIRTILAQLQAIAPSPSTAVVRLPADETWMIKQVLDLGAQTILVPMVESGAQARKIVAATRYAPVGSRGVGAALARASRFSAIGDYMATAGDEICVLVQVETSAGAAAVDELIETGGVDGIFVGPADLAADMGHPGNPAHPDVQAAVISIIERVTGAGKAAGILSASPSLLKTYFELGALFVAVGTDVGTLNSGLRNLREQFR